MKKTITKTFTETFEIEVNFPMFVKNESFSSTWIYALLSEEEYIEVAVGKNINAVKTLYLPVDRYIDFPQITEEEFLKAYAEANSVNVLNYHKHFTKPNAFIETQAEISGEIN